MPMDIYSKKGSLVRFAHPRGGYEPDIRRAAQYLQEGLIYTVARTRVHSFSTDVFLEEFPYVPFNSCLFDDVVVVAKESGE